MFIEAKDYVQYERAQATFYGAALATMGFCEDEWKWYVVGGFFLLWALFNRAASVAKKRSNGLVHAS